MGSSTQKRFRTSAGVVVWRPAGPGGVEVLLGHLGGPLFARKDDGAWTIPKGEYDPVTEEPRDAAVRELAEETGIVLPAGTPLVPLGEVRQSNGKRVSAWAAQHDADPQALASNTFTMVWPPRSGREREFPELDRFGWFTPDQARVKVVGGQDAVLDRLDDALRGGR